MAAIELTERGGATRHLATPFAHRRPSRERRLVRVIIASDAVVLSLAAGLAVLLRPEQSGSTIAHVVWSVATVGLALLTFSFERLYERDRGHIAVSTLDEAREFGATLSFLCFAEVMIVAGLDVRSTSAATIGLFWLAAVAALPISRGMLRHLVVPLLNTPQNTLIVGAGQVGQVMARKLRKHPEYNLRLVGFLDNAPHPLDADLDDLPVLGREDDLVSTIRRYRIGRVLLAFSMRTPDAILELIRAAGLREVTLSIVPRYFEIITGSASMADVDGIPVIELPPARLSRLARATKRLLDIVCTTFGLVVLSPVFLVVSAAIKLETPGPVFFRQPRRGREGREFRIVKFRTMVDGAENLRSGLLHANESSGPLFKIREDPRTTRVGRLLRRTSLDELPQLWNVLRGQMSLVGPRPFVVYEDDKIDGWARRRLELTPGITGPWQVLGRNDIGFEEMVRLDYLYVTNWSLWWDIKLLLQTIGVVCRRRGY